MKCNILWEVVKKFAHGGHHVSTAASDHVSTSMNHVLQRDLALVSDDQPLVALVLFTFFEHGCES